MNKLELWYFQKDALTALNKALIEKPKENPLIVVPTGGGKSLIIANFINEKPSSKILVLTHRKELIEQNRDELFRMNPKLAVDIYSAGLGKKDLESNIIISSIQSYAKLRISRYSEFDYIIIDECHLVSSRENTTYHNVLKHLRMLNPRVRIIGFSATPYRLDSGILTEGKSRIFHNIAYEISITELIEEGYLCPLITKIPSQLDLSEIRILGGDYEKQALENKLSEENLVRKTITDLISRSRDRKSWLIFATGKRHLRIIAKILTEYGISHAFVYSGMKNQERINNLNLFKAQEIQALINIDILTTGFNATNIDLIALLRPTKSTGLYVQMIGRGLRKDSRKKDCLVLDYANLIKDHGPIDELRIIKTLGGLFLLRDYGFNRVCTACQAPMRIDQEICKQCGKEYDIQHRNIEHNTMPTELSILGGNPTWVEVSNISCKTGINTRRYTKEYKVPIIITYNFKDYPAPLKLKFFPFGSTFEVDSNEEDQRLFKEWLKLSNQLDIDLRRHPDISVFNRQISVGKIVKYLAENHKPTHVMVIKDKWRQPRILGYKKDYLIQEKSVTDPILLVEDINENIVKEVINLYNNGFYINEASLKIDSSISKHKIKQIEKYIRSREFSYLLVSKEKWKELNFKKRFDENYEIIDNCWEWKHTTKLGSRVTPSLLLCGKRISVRSYIYKYFKKKSLRENQSVNNFCKNISCVNPDHLKVIIRRKSKFDSEGKLKLKLEETNRIKKVINLYNQGYNIKKAMLLSATITSYSDIREILRGKIKQEEFKDEVIIDKEKWQKINFRKKFEDNYIKIGDCWEWKGSVTDRAVMQFNGKNINIKKYSYETLKNVTLKKSETVMNTCEILLCVNPDHMRITNFSQLGKNVIKRWKK